MARRICPKELGVRDSQSLDLHGTTIIEYVLSPSINSQGQGWNSCCGQT